MRRRGLTSPVPRGEHGAAVKPLRRECRSDFGVPVLALRASFSFARKAVGAACTRHSLRPLFPRERRFAKPGRIFAPRGRGVMSSSLRAKRSNPFIRLWRYGLLRRFAPRNDDDGLFENQIGNKLDVVPDKRGEAERDPGPITTGLAVTKVGRATAWRSDSGLWLWVPAFAGTTAEFTPPPPPSCARRDGPRSYSPADARRDRGTTRLRQTPRHLRVPRRATAAGIAARTARSCADWSCAGM